MTGPAWLAGCWRVGLVLGRRLSEQNRWAAAGRGSAGLALRLCLDVSLDPPWMWELSEDGLLESVQSWGVGGVSGGREEPGVQHQVGAGRVSRLSWGRPPGGTAPGSRPGRGESQAQQWGRRASLGRSSAAPRVAC